MTTSGWACLRKSREDHPPRKAPEPRDQPTQTEIGEAILCRACLQTVTGSGLAVEIDGAHDHVFSNPAGLLFEIGCFSAAPGCIDSGDSTTEFSWFSGFAWRFASCRGCAAHLGWLFEGPRGREFWGLILNRLIEG